MIDGHGDDLHLFKGGINYNFSSNVYYKGCSSLLLNFLQENITTIQNYPSPGANELNKLAAEKHQLSENQFLFTNGATEAFYIIVQHFKGKKASIVAPTFAEYEDACKIHQIDYSLINLSNCKEEIEESNLVFICNPNNPNGHTVSVQKIETLLKQFSATFFVVDEAYIEFTQTVTSCTPLIKEYKNLIVVKSLTKTFVIPGLRLGYVVSNAYFIKKLIKLKMPWSVNSMAIEAGKFIFNNYNQLNFNVGELLQETQVFCAMLSQIKWLEVIPSKTSYFLVQLKKGKAVDLKKYLVEEHQILIRDATNFNKLEGEFIRLSTQHQMINKQLVEALEKWN